MKKKTLFGTALLALLLSGSQPSFALGKATTPQLTYKLKSVKVTKLNAKIVQYYFSFVDNNGHSVTVSGRGTLSSGRIDYLNLETSSAGTVYSGVANGTFSIDGPTGICTIEVTFTPAGRPEEYYTGESSWDII